MASTDGGADAGKEVIDAHRTQIGAFPCHVGAGDDDEKRSFHHVDVIADTAVTVHQRMAQGFGTETEGGRGIDGCFRFRIAFFFFI